MHKMILSPRIAGWLVCVAALVLLDRTAPSARAQGVQRVQFGDIVIESHTWDRPETGHGYRDHRFKISNRAAVAHRVTLTAPERKHRWTELRSISQEVEVPAGGTREVHLWQPALRMEGGGAQVAIDGRVQPHVLGMHFHMFPQNALSVLLGPAVDEQLRWEVNRVDPQGGQRFGGEIRAARLHPDVRQWSAHWLSYSSYDGIVLHSKDFAGIPNDVKGALLRYVECGGSLTLLGACEPPAHWKRSGFSEHRVEAKPQAKPPAKPPAKKPKFAPPPPPDPGETTRCRVGFGECFIMTQANFRNWNDRQRADIAVSWATTASPFQFQHMRQAGQVNAMFEIVKNVEVPVRGLFLLMIGFVVLIGPVNLLWLTRSRRRLWLLWTVPAISLVTCLCVLGYMVLSEGTTTHTRTEALTILDEVTGRATTIGWTGIYSPMTPRDGLHFDEQTELSGLWRSHWGRTSSNRTIDWSDGQHLNAGWIAPRVPVHFQVRKSEARTERLTFRTEADGSVWVTNGLPAALTRLHVADSKGRVFTAKGVAAGTQAKLMPPNQAADEKPGVRLVSELRDLFKSDWPTSIQGLVPQEFLLPGCYVAQMDASPFLEDGLRLSAVRRQRAVVFGILKEPFDAR